MRTPSCEVGRTIVRNVVKSGEAKATFTRMCLLRGAVFHHGGAPENSPLPLPGSSR